MKPNFPTLRAVFIGLCLISTVKAVQADISVTDDQGNEVRLKAPAKRIVTLAPSLTELLFTINKGDTVVGTVEYSDYPEAAKSIPRIGNFQSFSVESVLRLEPDLILTWKYSGGRNALIQLQKIGIPVFVSEPTTIEDVGETLTKLGLLTGSETAEVAKQAFRNKLQHLRTRYSTEIPVSVFYQIWNDPLQTVNKQHLISQIIDLCGGSNSFGDLKTLAPVVSHEAVIHRDPQVIIVSDANKDIALATSQWEKWTSLTAVQHRQIHTVNPDLLHRHTTRILDGALQLCKKLEVSRHYYDQQP